MKKLSILFIGLLLVTGFAFAQDVTVAGSATVTFGIDLDSSQTGFENTADASISLMWLGGDVAAGTEGWINLTEWEISFEDPDADDVASVLTIARPTVEAGWMFDPVTITIYAAPEFAGGEAEGIGYEAADPVKDIVTVGLTAANATPGYQGLTVDVDLGAAALTLLVASDGTWVENTNNDYVLGAEVSTTAGPATIAAGVYAGPLSDAMDLAFDLGVDLVAGPATVGIGFDGALPTGGDLAWDASLDVGLDVAGIGVDVGVYIYTPVADLDMDADIMLDLSGLVEALTLSELFQTQSILGDAFADWYSETVLGYAITDQIAASATFAIDDASVIDLDLAVTFTGFVENTVFELAYTVDDIENSNGAITFAGTITLP